MLKTKPLMIASIMTSIIIMTSCSDTQVSPSNVKNSTTNGLLENTLPTTLANSTNLVYEEKVEGATPFSTAHNWDIGSWDYALQFVSTPVYQGKKSARFEIREDQPLVASGKRAEVTIVKGTAEGVTKDTWYSFAVFFPTVGYEFDSEREVINQWFQNGSPATSLRTRKDRILLESGNTTASRKQYDLGLIPKDTWNTFVIHFIHSYGSDGLIELWHNGTKKLTLQGGNMYNDILPKWKIGLYKSAFKNGTSDVTKRIIYFDNVRVGNDKSTYETMKPDM